MQLQVPPEHPRREARTSGVFCPPPPHPSLLIFPGRHHFLFVCFGFCLSEPRQGAPYWLDEEIFQ